MKYKNVLFFTQGNWIEGNYHKVKLEEFRIFFLNMSLYYYSKSGDMKPRIWSAKLNKLTRIIEKMKYSLIVGHSIDVMILKHHLIRKGMSDIPSIMMTLESDFTTHEKFGAFLGQTYGGNLAHEMAISPNVYWFYPTMGDYERFVEYGISPDNLAYLPYCTFTQSIMNPKAVQYLNNSNGRKKSVHPSVEKVKGGVLAAGIFNRDYVTFLRACSDLDLNAYILTDFERLYETIDPHNKDRLSHELKRAENVEILNPVPLDIYISCLKNASIVVVPLLNENFTTGHLTISDAQKLSKPIVATNFPTSRDFITHMQSGLLFNPGDTTGLKENMDLLIKNSGIQKRVGQGGRKSEYQISLSARDVFLSTLRNAAKLQTE